MPESECQPRGVVEKTKKKQTFKALDAQPTALANRPP
jgi:hypothetical protein